MFFGQNKNKNFGMLLVGLLELETLAFSNFLQVVGLQVVGLQKRASLPMEFA
jgi:hypothetical protein